jgi:F-type H+-transporting ATPase subunit epsilon
MSGKILLEVVSPQRMVYKEEVDAFTIPGTLGYLGILPNHAPIISSLNIGVLSVKRDGQEDKIALNGGFLEVSQNKAVVLAETAEVACDIDLKRAEAAKERAEQRLAKSSDEVDLLRAEMALKRALTRIKTVRG